MKKFVTWFGFAAAVTVLTACSGGYGARQYAQEKMACAELGLAPGGPGFGQCAADLDAAMFAADHPN